MSVPRRNDRPHPHNLDAEKAILGSCLIDSQAFAPATGIVAAHDFYRFAHRLIFLAMGRLESSAIPNDLIALCTELEKTGDREKAGGPAYLSALTGGVPRSANTGHYARIVLDQSRLRWL